MPKSKKKPFFNLDSLATAFGAVIGVAQLLVATEHINHKDGLLIAGLATIALGVVTNKRPAVNPSRHDFSHLGVSTYQNINPEMVEAMNHQPPNRRMKELTRGLSEDSEQDSRRNPLDDRLERKPSQMGDRANPLDREGIPQDPDRSEY